MKQLTTLFLILLAPMLALGQITTLHNTLRRIPIQDTTGNIVHGYHITYDTLTGEMIWAADAGGSGHPHRVDTSGSGDLVNLDSLTLWQGFGIDLAAVTSANWDSVKFYLDTAWITANYSPPFADSTDKITDDGVGYNDIDWGAGANQVELVDVPATAWRVFYSNGSGVITELVLGANGTYLESNGAAAAPTFTVPSGAGLSFFTEADDNDTSVFTATAPNTTVAFNDQLTMQGNNITGVGDIEMTGNDILELHAMDVDSGFILQDADAGVFRTYVQFVHDTMFFGAIDATNGFERIWQWRTSVLTGLTLPTLGVPIITGNVDWTANIIDMNYLDTAEIMDSIESKIGDSIALALRHDGSQALTADWAAGDFDITGLEALEADTVIATVEAVLYGFRLRVNGALYTYDSTDVPVDGDVLTLNTSGTTLDWQPASGGSGLWNFVDSTAITYIADSTGDSVLIITDGATRTSLSTENMFGFQFDDRIAVDLITPEADDGVLQLLTGGSGDTLLFGEEDVYVGAFVPDSLVKTRYWIQLEMADSLDEYSLTTAIVLRDGSQALTANWPAGDFDITGLERLEADTIEAPLIRATGAASGTLQLSGATSGSWSLTVADVAGTPAEWVLPTVNGSSGYHLATDGAGALSWAAPGAGAWTDAGTIIYPTTGTGDTVVVGGTTAANSDIILGGDGTVVFNEQGNGVDFRVEGDTAQYLFEVNGSKTDTGEVNINGGLNVTLPADDNITIDGRTFPRTVTLGAMRWNHTPEASTQNTKALYLDIDANSVASTEALHIEYKATLLAAGETGVGIDFEGNTSTSIGGVLAAFNVNKVGIGSATVRALQVGPAVDDVIHHNSGSFGVVGYARDSTGGVHTDFTAAFNSSAIDSTMFDNDNDVIYIGEDATFNEIDVVLNTAAGGAGIDPVFEFSIAGPGWTAFTPIDNTEGFRVDGDIIWETADLTSWAAVTVDGQSAFWIRITRTRNSIPVDPIEDRIRTVASIAYTWNSTGDVNINSVVFEGATDDGFEQTINTIEPTADRAFNFPDDQMIAGDVLVASDASDLEYLNLATTEILIGDGSGIPTAASLSGDATMTNTGVVTVTFSDTSTVLARVQGDPTKIFIDAGDTIRYVMDGQNGAGDTLKFFHRTGSNGVGYWGQTNNGWTWINDSTMYLYFTGHAAGNEDVEFMMLADTTILRSINSIMMLGDATILIGAAGGGNLIVDSADINKYTDGSIDLPDLAAGAVDSTKITDGDLSRDDINWEYEWIYLETVHGWGRALEDSSYLRAHLHDNASAFLFLDYAGDITPTHEDTLYVSGYVPFDCTIDSLEFVMKETGSGFVDSIEFVGPDLSSAVNILDSTYWNSATDQSGAAWAIKALTFSSDVTASAGDRYGLKFVIDFAADNDSLWVGWVRIRVRR